MSTGDVRRITTMSDAQGRLRIELDGGLHEVGIAARPEPVLAVSSWKVAGAPWATNGSPMRLTLKLLNKGAAAARGVTGTLTSRTKGVRVVNGRFSVPAVGMGEAVETREFQVELDAAEREIVQLAAELKGIAYPLELPVFSKSEPLSAAVVVDGSKAKVWQRAIRQVETMLGAGNGDGQAEWGEDVVLGIRDADALRLVEVLASDPCAEISERVLDSWGSYDNVGATAKYTVIRLSSRCKGDRTILLFVEYQLPNKPEHTLKQGVVSLAVRGTGRTPPRVQNGTAGRDH